MTSGTRRDGGIDPTANAPQEAGETHTQQIARLEKENRLRREFIANVLHDIRSALSAVKGYLETPMVNADLAAGVYRQYMKIAHKHTVRLDALVNELFALSMLDDIDAPTQRERFSLAELAMDTAIAFKLQAEKKKIRLTCDTGAQPAPTVGNIAQIQRALENLIGNAIRFTPESGRVAISVTPGDESITVAISDSGPGIPEERLPRVFERFYSAPAEKEAKSDSAGLGLAIVKRILDCTTAAFACSARSARALDSNSTCP